MGKYQPFLNLEGLRFDELRDDIARHGVILPIIVDEEGEVIDGHQRRRACAELHIDCPRHVVEGLTEEEKQTLAVTLNLFRRQLGGNERSKAIGHLVRLGLSTRRIADIVGMSKSAVQRAAAEVEDRPGSIVGADGREQPAVRTSASTVPNGTVPEGEDQPPSGVDPETGEVAGEAAPQEAEDPTPSASGPDTDAQEDQGCATTPAPPLPVDPTLGYRAAFSRARSSVRSDLFKFDPKRCVETSDDRKAVADFAADLHQFAADLEQALGGSHLKAVQ